MSTHKELLVWQKSISLVKRIYQETKSFPREELMGITAQMRRAAVSIPSNIAEGYGRESDKELLHFLYIALGSAAELDTQLIVCREVELMQDTSYQDLSTMVGEIIRMLAALINSRKLGLRKL
jgi:S23 ribosomal protein